MKNFTFYQFMKTLPIIVILFSVTSYSQNIKFTFENAQNTNDGSFDYYEVDVMIQTIDELTDFKLGSGQLYFNYNTSAFGTSIFTNNGFQVSADDEDGYFLGEKSGFTDFYNINTLNDNTASRVSWAFSQGVSSGAMTEVVSATPKKMLHLIFKYTDANQEPMVAFEGDEAVLVNCRDQFFTACGPYDSASTTLDCSSNVDAQNVNTQFLDAILDNDGATLSDKDIENPVAFAIYPNPARDVINIKTDLQLTRVELFDFLGKRVLNTTKTKQLKVSHFNTGVYFLKAHSTSGTLTKKIMIE